ncbi:MAG: cupin domain-containing protein [Gemmataceae bacterium]
MSESQHQDASTQNTNTATAETRSLPASAGDPSFMNNVPDPLLADKELPTFQFALEKSEGKVIGNSYGKEATVTQLPISKGIAGVSMRLEPGVMRELHWHATAAEWAFVIEGRVRTTVIDPAGNAETNDFEPGDVWYFPRGHGHMLQCLGNQPCHFILIFDNGYFSEFGTFSITDWIGHTPKSLLTKNFGLPAAAFANFPTEEVYFARGPIPPEQPAPALQGPTTPPETHKYRLLAQPPHRVFDGGREWRVDSTHFPISKTITGVVLDLDPGAFRELHWHPTADEWQYVLAGNVSVTLFGSHGRYRIEQLEKGDVGYIPQGYGHSIENVGDSSARLLIGFNTGIYASIDLSQWIAGNPADVLATNFGQPPELFTRFPKRDVFLAPKSGPSQ